jgi:endonuclease/exonuclease/phosphatase (EEP) superfamily protein YafD
MRRMREPPDRPMSERPRPARHALSTRRLLRAVALLPPVAALAACVALTAAPRAVIMDADRSVRVRSLPCSAATASLLPAAPAAERLDPHAIRVVTWNIHKQADAGWRDDLARFARSTDLVLLQEATLDAALQEVLEDAGLVWVMASSFLFGDVDIGVLTATRTPPIATCTERTMEPLLGLPKSAVISWFALEGTPQTLAVVNVHAINFAVTLGAYRAQFVALTDALRAHRGPIVFAGDLNTWNQARHDAVREAARTLRLDEITLSEDRRSLFFGRQLDHLLVRGLDVVDATAVQVVSSDHNPVLATLRIAADRGDRHRDRE